MSTGVANNVPYGLSAKGDERTGFAPACGRTASTRRVYASHWAAWEKWSEDKGVAALPAEPNAVAAYLSHRLTGEAKAATVRNARAAISARHLDAGLDDPTTDARVNGLLSGSARASARPQRQVTGITARELEAIKATATTPRIGPSGRCESQAQAQAQGAGRHRLDLGDAGWGDGAVVGRGGNLVGHPVGGRRQRASGNPAFPN